MSLSVGAKLDRYKIRSLIGPGGMVEVYLATDTELDRTAPTKILANARKKCADSLAVGERRWPGPFDPRGSKKEYEQLK